MSGTPTYHYYLKDHLGNNRVVVNQVGTVAQQTDYYPFGMAFNEYSNVDNKYLYNGKELQKDAIGNGLLDWYDFEARYYDAALGRTTTQDPHAESYYSHSPYSMFFNNPLLFIDPTGMDPIYGKNFWGNTKLIGDDGKTDDKSYLVKGSVKRDVKSATKEGNDYSGSLAEGDKVMHVPTGDVMGDVISSVDATNTSGKENGGHVNEGDTKATPWDEGTPAKEVKDAEGNVTGAKASISPFVVGGKSSVPTDASKTDVYWHTHPNTTVGGVSLGSSTPSAADKSFQGTMESRGYKGNAFVIGTKSKTVTFYNSKKSLITIKYKDFKTMGGK